MAVKLQRAPCKTAFTTIKKMFHSVSGELPRSPQGVCRVRPVGEEITSKLLDRKWMLKTPHTEIHQIVLSATEGKHRDPLCSDISFFNNTNPCLGGDMIGDDQDQCFYVVRDDLLHPLVNGNKARKLDALLPLLEDHSVTDVVTCGGCQSSHTTAVAVSCAERGLKSHLLLRGEQPEILTGYNLISTMYGNVNYVPRSIYANREEMLKNHANLIAGNNGYVLWCNELFEASVLTQTSTGSDFMDINANKGAAISGRKVVIVNEGAGDVVALLGVFRLLQYLSQDHLLGQKRVIKFVVDAGTGTTAVGLGLGAACLGLPWEITAVMLADTTEGYKKQEIRLISDFTRVFGFPLTNKKSSGLDCGVVHWVERSRPRKFGNVLDGEIAACQRIARLTGISVDPVYTLAAWEMATLLSDKNLKEDANVVMLHTGGTLGMFGLAQRYKSYFTALNDGLSQFHT